jgi:hypothetical protein
VIAYQVLALQVTKTFCIQSYKLIIIGAILGTSLVLRYWKRVRFGGPHDEIIPLICQRFLVAEPAHLTYLINSICYVLLNMSKLLTHLTVKVGRPDWKIIRLKGAPSCFDLSARTCQGKVRERFFDLEISFLTKMSLHMWSKDQCLTSSLTVLSLNNLGFGLNYWRIVH